MFIEELKMFTQVQIFLTMYLGLVIDIGKFACRLWSRANSVGRCACQGPDQNYPLLINYKKIF